MIPATNRVKAMAASAEAESLANSAGQDEFMALRAMGAANRPRTLAAGPEITKAVDDDAVNGPVLEFEYIDKAGNLTHREVWGWSEEGDRFTGICMDSGNERTFLKASVVRWIAGSDRHLETPFGD
jgi:hypothetical protein